MSSSSTQCGAVVFAKDIARVAGFYRQLLSMSVTHSAPDHIALASPQCELVVHGIPPAIAATFTIATPPALREDTPIKLFFYVPSLAEARTRAAALGGGLKPESAAWEARGFRACDGHDPEGNVVQLRERLA